MWAELFNIISHFMYIEKEQNKKSLIFPVSWQAISLHPKCWCPCHIHYLVISNKTVTRQKSLFFYCFFIILCMEHLQRHIYFSNVFSLIFIRNSVSQRDQKLAGQKFLAKVIQLPMTNECSNELCQLINVVASMSLYGHRAGEICITGGAKHYFPKISAWYYFNSLHWPLLYF